MLVVNNLSKIYSPRSEPYVSGCGIPIHDIHSVVSSDSQNYAVHDVSFNVQKHEIVAIIGENGSGKSTLLKLIAGMLRADSGTIFLNNRPVEGPENKLVAGHEHIKLIYQNFNLFPNKTLKENIAYGMRFLPEDYQEQRMRELLTFFQLENISHHYPREVSGGEQQRTAIATALSTRTELLLFDEPFSNLDVYNGFKLVQYIKRLNHRYAIPILFVSHHPQEIFRLATRVIAFRMGKIVQNGTPSEVYEKPANAYVAGLLGTFNPIQKKWAKEYLELNKSYSYGIRFEHVYFADTSNPVFEGTVQKIWHNGINFIYQIAVIPSGTIHLYHPTNIYTPGDKVTFSLDRTKIFRI